MTDQFTILKGNTPDPYVDVLIKFPSNMAVGFIDRDNVWSVYSGGGWYTEVAKNDEQPIAWKALNQESMDEQEKRNELMNAKNPVYNEQKYGDYLAHCPSCEKTLPMISQYGKSNYCYHCGQAVKWND